MWGWMGGWVSSRDSGLTPARMEGRNFRPRVTTAEGVERVWWRLGRCKVCCLVLETQRLSHSLVSHKRFSLACFWSLSASASYPFCLSGSAFSLSLCLSESLSLGPLLSPSSIRSGWGLRALPGVTWAVCTSADWPQTPRAQLQLHRGRVVAEGMCL